MSFRGERVGIGGQPPHIIEGSSSDGGSPSSIVKGSINNGKARRSISEIGFSQPPPSNALKTVDLITKQRRRTSLFDENKTENG
jgi:hypothetical protein